MDVILESTLELSRLAEPDGTQSLIRYYRVVLNDPCLQPLNKEHTAVHD